MRDSDINSSEYRGDYYYDDEYDSDSCVDS